MLEPTRIRFSILWSLLGLGTTIAHAQRAATMSPDVRRFVAHDAPVIALKGVRIIDGTGAAPRDDQTIVFTDGRISAIGASVSIPAGATVLSLPGHTVTPGLVMLHEHLFYPTGRRTPGLFSYVSQNFSFPKLYLAFGATTIRTAGATAPYVDMSLKEAIDAGKEAGPLIYLTSPFLDRPGYPIPHFNHIESPEGGRRAVRYWAEEGIPWFKAYTFVTRADLKAIIDEAHRLGGKVTAHLCSVTHSEAADLGIDMLEHALLTNSEFVAEKQVDLCPGENRIYETYGTLDISSAQVQAGIRKLVEKRIPVSSTLPIWETMMPDRMIPAGALEVLSPELRDDFLAIQKLFAANRSSTFPAAFKAALEWERQFVRAGGILGAGTDPTGYGGTVAGYGNIRELELLVEAGFTPLETISIATRNGARILGISDQVGTLEVGKRADAIVIRGDPATHIADMGKPVVVFRDGIGYDSVKLIAAVKGLVGRF
ncbi:MAG: amidohydrolase family protein [Gemmatimonadales bacterium]